MLMGAGMHSVKKELKIERLLLYYKVIKVNK